MVVCLKMLFRRSTRKRFVCLVAAFACMMAFNIYGYARNFHEAEKQKSELLSEKAFQVFFLRFRTSSHLKRFFARPPLEGNGAVIPEAFIYQNNLYLHLVPPPSGGEGLDLLLTLFHGEELARGFAPAGKTSQCIVRVPDQYIDYNGGSLSPELQAERHTALRFDLVDIADMLRERLYDRRIDVFNSVKNRLVGGIQRIGGLRNTEPNSFFSRVECIVPMNLLHVFAHIARDNTTDVMDLLDSVKVSNGHTLQTYGQYLRAPVEDPRLPLYAELNVYPRYIPFYTPNLLTPQRHWMFYRDIRLQDDLLAGLRALHSQGHYLFSYEKLHFIEKSVDKINRSIRANHVHFYLTDLSMGIVFPFMMSLFAFIHLKSEIAYILMFKNRIRQILVIFWGLPLAIMLGLKGCLLALYPVLSDLAFPAAVEMALPLGFSFLVAALCFYPVNQWCFSQFTGDTIRLHALHKGR